LRRQGKFGTFQPIQCIDWNERSRKTCKKFELCASMNPEDRPAEQDDAMDLSSRQPWQLRLYINGRASLKSIVTLENIKELCQKHLAGRFNLEVVDLVENFAQAREDHVIALPTLVRRSPLPVRKIIGDLSNTDQVITALGLPAVEGGQR
jgi:circadian clock protein KaiB